MTEVRIVVDFNEDFREGVGYLLRSLFMGEIVTTHDERLSPRQVGTE